MLITISGLVGTGKSTIAHRVVQILGSSGMKPRYVRFRSVTLFDREWPPASGSANSESEEGTAVGVRGRDFRPRNLTAVLTLGYAVRILAFRLSGIGSASRCDVVDRYFYDNLMQYELNSRRARMYAGLLRRLMPTPDLALLLVASDDTISSRRPEYAREYVAAAGQRYEMLTGMFPNLVRICTDTGSPVHDEILRLLNPVLTRRTG